MKSITLTSNEVLTLIAEGMTMNNVTSLANKLRNADAPAVNLPAVSYETYHQDLEKAKAHSITWEQSYHDAMVNLEKAKQTESTLRQQIKEWENAHNINDESLKYFRKWVEELRVATGYDEGVTAATVFSNSIELVRQHNELCKRAADLESKLVKANDVIACVRTIYEDERKYNDVMILDIEKVVENYYRGN